MKVQAFKSDGWDYEPFVLTNDKKTGRLYGRGSTDDKGPVLGWLNVLEAHRETKTELPVNLRMCFEGMEESGSEGLDELVHKEAGKGGLIDASTIDAICISDNFWLGTTVRAHSSSKRFPSRVGLSTPRHLSCARTETGSDLWPTRPFLLQGDHLRTGC